MAVLQLIKNNVIERQEEPIVEVDDSNPRIFTGSLLSRLSSLNQAARILRAAGYHVLSETLAETDRDRSVIHIERDAQTPIARLLDCTQHFWKDDVKTGKKYGVAWFYGGVQIVWEEL